MDQDQFNLTNDNFAWSASFIGVIVLLIVFPIINGTEFLPLYKFIKKGILITLLVTVCGIMIASALGILVGVGRAWNNFLNRLLSIYVEVIRGIPLLVQLMYIYFVLGKFLHLDRITAAIVALGFCYGAYMAEIVRSGLLSISTGQIEAAQSLGMNKFQIYRYVIIPQAIKIIIPPYGNEFIAMLKDSSLVSIIAVSDIMQNAKVYSATHFNYFESYTIAALLYLLLTLFFSKAVSILEKSIVKKRK